MTTTSSQTTTTADSSPSNPYPSFNSSNSIKLTRTNYPIWKAQIVPYLKGQEVYGFVDGSILAPPATINGSPNPALPQWTKQDNLILSAITSSLSEDVLTHVYHAKTSAEIWSAIERCFASQSRARIIHLRSQLATTRKAGSTATEYFMTVKRLTDDLALAGQPLQTDDIINYILSGLGSDYDALVAMVGSRSDITVEEVFSLLLTMEARINHNNSAPAPVPTLPPPPQLASSTPHPSANSNQRSHNNRGRNSNSRGRGRGRSNGSRPQQQQSPNPSIQCQLCGKFGHSVLSCGHRFDPNFTPSQPQNSNPAPFPRPPMANFAGTSYDQTNWLPNTGASHHMTPYPHNFNSPPTPYNGDDNVRASNGTGLLGPGPS